MGASHRAPFIGLLRLRLIQDSAAQAVTTRMQYTHSALLPPLGMPCGRSRERVFGPRMLRVASAQLGAHLLIAVGPERGEVGSDRDRSLCGREQLQLHRHAAVDDAWGLKPAKALL